MKSISFVNVASIKRFTNCENLSLSALFRKKNIKNVAAKKKGNKKGRAGEKYETGRVNVNPKAINPSATEKINKLSVNFAG